MKQVTIILRCPDSYNDKIVSHISDPDRINHFQYKILAIDVKEIDEKR